jgi:hypothetical protein
MGSSPDTCISDLWYLQISSNDPKSLESPFISASAKMSSDRMHWTFYSLVNAPRAHAQYIHEDDSDKTTPTVFMCLVAKTTFSINYVT